jgi:hypothetical protein
VYSEILTTSTTNTRKSKDDYLQIYDNDSCIISVILSVV